MNKYYFFFFLISAFFAKLLDPPHLLIPAPAIQG